MDVTCERCGTVYEFEEALVSARGTVVKCTQCDHIFKVLPPSAARGPERGWHLRKADGAERLLTTLRELQASIARGELSREDSLSRDGTQWKRLGDIAELQSFFSAAPSPSPSRPAQPREHQRTRLGLGPSEPAPPPAAASPEEPAEPPPSPPAPAPPADAPPTTQPARVHKPTLLGVGGAADPDVTRDTAPAQPAEGAPASDAPPAQPATSAPPSVPPDGAWTEGPGLPAPSDPEATAALRPARRPRIDDPFADTIPAGSTGRRAAPTLEEAPRPPPARPDRVAVPRTPHAAAPRRPLYVDEEDEHAPILRKSRAWVWWTLVGLLMAGVGVFLAWPRIAAHLGAEPQEDAVLPFLERAAAALASDRPEGYRDAIREYTRATAVAEADPRVLAGLARAHALLAQVLVFRSQDLAARAPTDPGAQAEAAAARREAEVHTADARRFAEEAVRVLTTRGDSYDAPVQADAELALADGLRLAGNVPDAERALVKSRAGLPSHLAAEGHRVAGLVVAARAGGNLGAAQQSAERAVEADPDLLRARLLLARVLLAQRQVAGARAQVEAVLRRQSDHPQARELHQAIERGVPPAAPLVEVLDAGVPAEEAPEEEGTPEAAPEAAPEPIPTPAPEPTPPERGPATGQDRPAGAGGGAVAPGRDYTFYVSRGQELLERGDVGLARRHFEQALTMRPGGAEALTGMGFLALDAGDAAGAVRRFEPAARGGYVDAYIGLGDAYRRMGRSADAAGAYRTYLERRPNGAHASIARRQLQMLEAAGAPARPAPERPGSPAEEGP
jgi:predicted Zn finger-like uncharacterized protein